MLQLTSASLDEFDSFALKHPAGNFHQTSHMIAFRKALGWDTHPLFLVKQGTIVGALVLAGKNGRYEVTMGPLVDFSDNEMIKEFLRLLEQYVKRIGGSRVELYPYEIYQVHKSDGKIVSGPNRAVLTLFAEANWQHKGLTVEYDLTANRWVFVKDLSGIKDEAELLSSYRQTTRQTIKKLDTAHYSIKKMSFDELDVVKSLIDSSNERNDVHNRPLSYYQHLYTHFGDAIEFLVVYHQGNTPISTGIFISHPHELVYFLSGADSHYRHLYGGHFLQHYVMSRAIKEGVTRYNFYGVSGHFTKNPLLVYKSGFRGIVEEYVGGFFKVVNPTKYAAKKAVDLPKKIIKRILR